MINQIKKIIEESIPNSKVFISDPQNDGLHFKATVISSTFLNLPLVKQHTLVMSALKDFFNSEQLHALQLKTLPPLIHKIVSWNINGLRSILKKNFISILKNIDADILCLQEIRTTKEDISNQWIEDLPYHQYFCCAEKKGYSGTAILSKEKGKEVECTENIAFDKEGRIQAIHFSKYTVLNAYFPNSRSEKSRLPYKIDFCKHIQKLLDRYRKEKKNVVLCGDYNIAHKAIDLKRPKENENSPGYYIEERKWMDYFLNSGYIDTFRYHHPQQKDAYTWWSYRTRARSRNIGWRIDYQCVNKEFISEIQSSSILSDIHGSDHCPIELRIKTS